MSVFITGMDMPKEGGEICIFADGSVWVNEWFTRRYIRLENAKVIPVPPHGRLTDADALREGVGKVELKAMEEYYELFNAEKECEYEQGVWDGLHMAAKMLSVAPTIIEAEEGENNA